MTIAQISAWIMLVFCGLWAGGILIFAVERTNLWRRMSIDQYAVDFRRSLFRVDPMMPILGVIAGAAATIFALQRSGAAKGLAWAGLGFIVLVVVASITIAEPTSTTLLLDYGCGREACERCQGREIRSLSAKATRWFVSNQSTLTYNIAAADEIANA